jgi:hypothetical protein
MPLMRAVYLKPNHSFLFSLTKHTVSVFQSVCGTLQLETALPGERSIKCTLGVTPVENSTGSLTFVELTFVLLTFPEPR